MQQYEYLVVRIVCWASESVEKAQGASVSTMLYVGLERGVCL